MQQGGVACKARGIMVFFLFIFSLPSVGKPTPPPRLRGAEFKSIGQIEYSCFLVLGDP